MFLAHIEVAKPPHGYVFNIMLSEGMTAALNLASNGVVAVEDMAGPGWESWVFVPCLLGLWIPWDMPQTLSF